jgi:hypothetical protein
LCGDGRHALSNTKNIHTDDDDDDDDYDNNNNNVTISLGQNLVS